MKALDEFGDPKRTIVVVTSDRGWHVGEKLITGKNNLWERSTHVPLILTGTRNASGRTLPEPVELLDVYSTLADLCCMYQSDSHSRRSSWRLG
jgi:choline-sulfatase